VAAAWGRQLRPEPDTDAPSFIRRMPANWSDLSPAERRALAIESVGKRRISRRALRRLSQLGPSQPKISAAAAERNGHSSGHAAGDHTVTGVAANGDGSSRVERRQDVRISADGRALIRAGDMTISAGLVDVSEGGLECVLPEAAPTLAPGAKLSGPFLLEFQETRAHICLDIAGWISWQRSTGSVTYLGIAFGELSDAQVEGVRRFLASALLRGSR